MMEINFSTPDVTVLTSGNKDIDGTIHFNIDIVGKSPIIIGETLESLGRGIQGKI